MRRGVSFLLVFSFLLIVFTGAFAGEKRLRIVPSSTPLGILNSRVIFIADQLENNLSGVFKGLPAVVTTFVNVNNFNSSNTFGRLMTEALMHELQVRGWNVSDIRLMQAISMNSRGEFVLSRDSKKVRYKELRVRLIVTGTYFVAGDSVIVNARVIDLATGRVLSTAQAVIPVAGMEGIFAPDLLPVIKVDG